MLPVIDIPELNILKQVELPTAIFFLLEGDVVWIRYKEIDDEFDIEQARKHTEVLEELNDSCPVHLVIDFRGLDIAFSREARAYFADNDGHSAVRASQAFILSGLAHKIVANFYIKFNKPSCPARIFSEPENALNWVRKLKSKDKLQNQA